jgi:mercuric ion transport protein
MNGLDLQASPPESQPAPSEAVQRLAITRKGGLATFSLIGAFLASTCCVVPLVFVTLGISGAWIGNLTALEPYKPYLIAATVILLGAGFWQVYVKPKPVCEKDSYCANPVSGRIIQGVLWLATLLVLLAATIAYWAPLFY